MKIEIPFKEVKLGETFELHSPKLACEGVRAEEARVFFESSHTSRLSNFVVLKILPTALNEQGRKVGDYDWCHTRNIVIVDRTLPSGS